MRRYRSFRRKLIRLWVFKMTRDFRCRFGVRVEVRLRIGICGSK